MTNPADQPPSWAAPGGSGDRPADEPQPPAPPTGWGAPAVPPAGQWGAPAVPPAGAWDQPPAPPAGQWGTPQVPPTWTGAGPQQPPAPAYGGYPAYPAGPQPWAPPVLQPGIIPLRPLSLGEILDGGVRAIRANPSVMFGLSSVAVAIAVLLSALLTYYVSGFLTAPIDSLFGSTTATLSPTQAGQLNGDLSYSFGTLVTRPITALVTTILTGLLVVSVSRSVLGRTITVREVLRSGRVWWVVGFSLLSGVAVVAVGALLTGIVVALAASHQTGAAVGVGLVALLGYLVAAVWFSTRTLLVTPALMLEGKGFWSTVARAWRLTRGSFWRLFGIWLLVAIIMGILEQIVVLPFSLVASLTSSGQIVSAASLAITSVGQVIALTATTTYTSAVVALLYIDVRMRREGLDIELGRAATADAAAAVR